MEKSQRLLDLYLPPEGFVLESLVATTYQVDFEFLEEELLAAALGVRSPISRMRAFRSELERKLQTTDVTVLYDLGCCDRLARLSPRIDPVPIATRKLHAKITLLMWVRKDAESAQAPERRIRLLVGSANLTRQGFRENYECVVSTDFGGRSTASRRLLISAIDLVRRIAAESASPQLARQLVALEAQAATFPEGNIASDDPLALVTANEVVRAVADLWTEISAAPPATIRVVSPFWPEGVTSSQAMAKLIRGFGVPEKLELICRGVLANDGKTWLPEFDAQLAQQIRGQLAARLFLFPTLPHVGSEEDTDVEPDAGDETEEREFAQHGTAQSKPATATQRSLHAKLLLLEGPGGCVLYVGSSNCTRKGLAIDAASNWEAGFVYRLSLRQRKQLDGLFCFAGPATEVLPDQKPETAEPRRDEEPAVPSFLAEVTATGTNVTIGFRPGASIPPDLKILMPVPSSGTGDIYRVLWPTDSAADDTHKVERDLRACPLCDAALGLVTDRNNEIPCVPQVFVEVRWQGNKTTFPVRFDDKATLPLLLIGRKATEGELIEYFLYGREPDELANGDAVQGANGVASVVDAPIDTRRILAYFMRLFVQAIPGIEAEISRATYSRTALDAALRGPTSPLELAERAYSSLTKPAAVDEPNKTLIAVAFQLTEILAALIRCQKQIAEPDLADCFLPVITRCREMLNNLVANHAELEAAGFQLYRDRFVEGVQ